MLTCRECSCNPRRPFDEDYATWVDVLQSSLSNGWEATKARGEEIMRAEYVASTSPCKLFDSHHLCQLQSLYAAKTAFFSNASHELRTPLTLIYSPLEDSLSRVTDSVVKSSLKLALRNASRLVRLVDSLMDFSRLEAGRLHGTFKPVHLSSFTLDLANMFRPTMEKHNLKVSI
jgi:signal transduction histidine kinase